MSNTRKAKPPAERKPVPLGAGRYAFFEDADGSGIIAYRPDGAAADSHQVVPAGLWKLVTSAMRGEKIDVNPVQLMKMIMGAR